VDAGFASLATFAIGLAAVTWLDDVGRGVYAVFFTAFVAASLLSTELIYTPAQVRTVAFPTSERLSLVPQTLRLGIGPTLLGTLAVGGAVAVTWSYTTAEVLAPLAVTSAISLVLSPMQDHVRRMLHIGALNWKASWISVVQFVVAVSSVAVGYLAGVPVAWIPFGALAIANAVSLSVGVIVARAGIQEHAYTIMRFRELATRGKWFVLAAVARSAAAFLVVTVIAWVASPEDLGYAESARVVAQPILVLAAGLSAVLGPRSMRAAMDGDSATARRTSSLYLGLMGLGGLAYVLMVAWDVPINPMARIVPSAYVLPGLVALTIAANVIAAAPFLRSNELAGAHRERTLAGIAWLSSTVSVIGGLTVWITGAYARPLSVLGDGASRYAAQSRVLETFYAKRTPGASAGPTSGAGPTDTA
jgi:O-antigen/teichoic acid export membrane protein